MIIVIVYLPMSTIHGTYKKNTISTQLARHTRLIERLQYYFPL